MSRVVQVNTVALLAPTWTVPATLADLECRHGELDGCTACASEDREAELELEQQLEVTA